MCSLIVLAGIDPTHAIVVASNRDEARARKAAPPGLWGGERHRVLSPRDRRAGGTWQGVNDVGMFAGITNIAGLPDTAGAPTRGNLPHLALDCDTVDQAIDAVCAEVAARRHSPFQLLVTDGVATRVVRHVDGAVDVVQPDAAVAVLSNEHALGELELPLAPALVPELAIGARLDALAELLVDDGAGGGHSILKRGDEFGTVSSSLIAVPRDGLEELVWRYAPGAPDQVAYRNYGNLVRRFG